jgi:2-iminobutanoate/2-iminopropanoate deaminase
MIERLSPPGIPAPRGPYSPAVRAGGFIFVSGQIPVDPVTNQLSPGDIKHETRIALNNVKLVLEGAGATLADVVRVGVFIRHAKDFAAMNEVYAEFFGNDKPARSTIVCDFIADIKVEIDCVAYKP